MSDPLIASDLRLRAVEDVLLRAADQVQALLREAAQQLRPFPPFPGAFFTFGIEVDVEGTEDRGVGCVVVTESGELKELQIGIDAEGLDFFVAADPVSSREEQLVDVDLTPYDRLLYAVRGLHLVMRVLQELNASETPGGGSVRPPQAPSQKE